MRTYANRCTDCGDTVAAMSEPEPGTALCYSCATGTPETRLVFVNLDTDTVEDCAHETFVIDPNTAAMTDAEREILETADHYGTFTDDAREIIRRIGVPLADLWAAYKREQERGNGFVFDRGWRHCGQQTEYDDEGVTCNACHRFMSWDDAEMRMAE